jgi:hypothetical protein
MEIIVTALLCYVGFGALVCATPRTGPFLDGFTPEAQFQQFLETLADVLIWPAALWRDFGP